jgi:hypothetical protein
MNLKDLIFIAPLQGAEKEGKAHVPQAAGATPPLHGAMIVTPLQGFLRLRRYSLQPLVYSFMQRMARP